MNAGNRQDHTAETTRVLFVAANPSSTSRLGLDEEIRRIQEKLRGSEYQRSIDLRAAWAARPDDLLQALNELRPDALHFSGHGDPGGAITFVDSTGNPKPVSPRALTAAIRSAGESVRLVVINACYSVQQASAVIEVAPCAIGMNSAIGDEAAIIFSAALYRALAFGHSVRRAFDQAIAALLLEGIPEENTPELLYRAGHDPKNTYLAGTAGTRGDDKGGLEIVDIGLVNDDRYQIAKEDQIVRVTLRSHG